jgi:hypothetical protein
MSSVNEPRYSKYLISANSNVDKDYLVFKIYLIKVLSDLTGESPGRCQQELTARKTE